ncbi:13444_t:CDS:1 [Ambispora gerdemannii]|uniref:13444_t:CDS:1 n=1 Tax=Ambispora gerdemannii TaxID=144530 RepID=A0A9N9C910_9GLOM|nr:13444_t:CDS:1 [Ambispora gerdemannii]
MTTEEAPKDSSTSKSGADAEVFQLEALSLNYLRSQNISVIPDDNHIPKLRSCKLCNKAILNFRFEAFTVLCCGHLLHRICLETYIMQGGVRSPSCPICNWDIEINREERGLASGECFLAPKSYDKGQASQQSNVTIEDDEGGLEIMRSMGLIEEDSVPAEQVSKDDQTTSSIADNSIFMQDQAIMDKDNNVSQENSGNQTNENNESTTNVYIMPDSTKQLKPSNSEDQSNANNENDTTMEENDTNQVRSSRQSSPKIARDQDKLLGLIRELSTPVKGETGEINTGESENSLARLYQKALKAENRVTQAYQEEIRCWYYYAEEFEKKVMGIRDNDRKIGDQQARTKVYDEIRDHLSGITKVTLRKKTQRARAIYNLFKKIGVEKIKRVHSYSADSLRCKLL